MDGVNNDNLGGAALLGQESASTEGMNSTVPSVELVGWFSENLVTLSGGSYKTVNGAIRHGLHRVRIPLVDWFAANNIEFDGQDPAFFSRVTDGTSRASAYNKDHFGRVVNMALTDFNRVTSVDLVTGLRAKCRCDDEACFIHTWEKEGGCGLPALGNEPMCITGDIAPEYHRNAHFGLIKTTARRVVHQVPILGVRYDKEGNPARLVVVGMRVATQRSGAGKSGGFKSVAFRYITTDPWGCGKSKCDGTCGGFDTHLLFTLVMTQYGVTQMAIDPRTSNVADVVSLLEAQVGNVVVSATPFTTFGGDNPA